MNAREIAGGAGRLVKGARSLNRRGHVAKLEVLFDSGTARRTDAKAERSNQPPVHTCARSGALLRSSMSANWK